LTIDKRAISAVEVLHVPETVGVQKDPAMVS
jgi:hypothetical protein